MRLRQLAMVGTLALVAMTGAAAQQPQEPLGPLVETIAIPISLADARYVQVRDDDGQVVLSGTLDRFKAQLAPQLPGSQAHGSAEIEVQRKGTQSTKEEIQLELGGLAPRAYYRLVLDGNVVARFLSDKSGKRDVKYTRKLEVK